MSKREGRAETAVALAPLAPPCFSSRLQWTEYVAACAIDQRDGHLPGPLLLQAGQPARFNLAFSICEDCDDRHAANMGRQGKCKPRYLIDLLAAKTAKETA